MNDKIVTHEDLSALRGIREAATSPTTYYPDDTTAKLTPLALLDRLIAAAEADQPPLPEGWVLYTDPVFVQRIVWHEDGRFTLWSDGSGDVTILYPGGLTPLRPTVTEADVERAVRDLGAVPGWTIDRKIRQAFAALGIEVTP